MINRKNTSRSQSAILLVRRQMVDEATPMGFGPKCNAPRGLAATRNFQVSLPLRRHVRLSPPSQLA